MLLPLLQFIIAIVELVLLSLEQCTIVIAQASLPLSRWHHCPCCTGAITNIAWALSPLLHWHDCYYPTDLFALALHGHCHCCCTNVVTPVELVCLRR
jgi:hypothetical protein